MHFLHLDHERFFGARLARLMKSDRGEKVGPLAGFRWHSKDIIANQKDIPTTAGSKILEGWRPSYDANHCYQNEGCWMSFLARRTVMSLLWVLQLRTLHHGPTHNPWDLSRLLADLCGSSASLCCFEAPFAIGTDTRMDLFANLRLLPEL